MIEENRNIKTSFKYNMSFYYQSTIIYFVVFIFYLIIRGEFVEDSFTLIFKDPIIYFFGIIVLIAVVALIYNIFKNKHLEVNAEGISFVNRFKSRTFNFDNIVSIKITRPRQVKRRKERKAFRLIRIKLKNRRRPIIIRPYDYENENELVKKFYELKERLEKSES